MNLIVVLPLEIIELNAGLALLILEYKRIVEYLSIITGVNLEENDVNPT